MTDRDERGAADLELHAEVPAVPVTPPIDEAYAIANAITLELPMHEHVPALLLDNQPRALAPRVVWSWRISMMTQAMFPSLLLGVGVWLIWRLEHVWWLVGAVAAPWLLAAVLAYRLPPRRYAVWRYQITDDALRLDRGVMVRVESVVPYTRIQHVDTEQGPIERALGLTRVIVHTASGTGSTLSIPGLTPADAAALRERLAALAGVVEPL